MMRGRLGRWLTRGLTAAPGLALLIYGFAAAPTPTTRLLQALGIPFLLFSATRPLWRKAPDGILGSAEPAREALRRRIRRVGAGTLFAAGASLIAGRALAAAGHPGAVSAADAVALGLAVLAAVPPASGFLLPMIGPASVRRTLRTADLIEELSTALPGRVPAGATAAAPTAADRIAELVDGIGSASRPGRARPGGSGRS